MSGWLGVGFAASPLSTVEIPVGVTEQLTAGKPQNLIIEFDSDAVENEAATERARRRLIHDDAAILSQRAIRYKALRQEVLGSLPAGEADTLIEYSHLPMAALRLRSVNALNALSRHGKIKAIFADKKKFPILTQSLPLISQPTVAAMGVVGTGTTTVVIDTGVDYTRSAFGSCTAPGAPATCKVNFYVNNADTSTALDSNGHGTNVSGIVLGVAPDTRVAMYNVFGASGTTTDSLILQGINWAIANQASYHVTAISMSLGDGVKYTSSCNNKRTNPYVTPVSNAKAAGIITVAASGNEGFTDGISSPACTPLVVSVGAVYDANVGGLQYSACTDSTTAADKVTCFSDSASFLTMLAPGAAITAAGYTMYGTSQATPHVSGAVAVLRAAYSGESVDQTISRLTSSGTLITDPRNGIIKPRLNLLAAARPANDSFASRVALSGNTGTSTGRNILATKEAGEPVHAGNVGGASVWWKWVAPASGQVALHTHGSSFDTLLAVYTGTGVTNLTAIAVNDNDGSANGNSGLYFEAIANAEYEIAIDGVNAATGNIAFNWSLNTAPQADLSVSITPSVVPPGSTNLVYAVKVTNNGPQPTTNTTLTINLDANLSLTSATGCSGTAPLLTCSIGTLSAAGTTTLQITTTTPASGTFTTSGSVASDTPDPVAGNNSATATTQVIPAADLILSASGSSLVNVNGPITYTVITTNQGPIAATGVFIFDSLPPGLTYVSASSSPECSGTTSITCTIGSLAINASVNRTITVLPTVVGVISNTFTVMGVETDPDILNNSKTVTTTVQQPISPDGDLNGDGVIDVADVALAERIALSLITPTAEQLAHGDVAPFGAPDGMIDAADVALVKRKALGM